MAWVRPWGSTPERRPLPSAALASAPTVRSDLLPFAVVPLGFLVVGLLLARVGFRAGRREEAFAASAARAPGVLTELRWRAVGRTTGASSSSRVAFPVVRFTTSDGREVEVETDQGRSPAPGEEGQALTVLYDPADPTRVVIEEFRGQGRTVNGCLGAMGVAFVVLALVFGAIGVFVLQAVD